MPVNLDELPAGPLLNRLVATLVCCQTGGLPDDTYPNYSGDVKLAFAAVDAFLAANRGVKLTIEYPMPEVWVRRCAEDVSKGSGWVTAVYVADDTLPIALCRALLRAAGHVDARGVILSD